jgi:beta-N-acetylhexosaminidase
MSAAVSNPDEMPTLRLSDAVGQRVLLSFKGTQAPEDILARVRQGPLGGFTLFRSLNVVDPEQVRHLTTELQSAAPEADLLIATDQEGGQLMSLAESTQFPGNMALGATGSADLAREVGFVIGRELRAVGVNVDYAPVCDVNSNPLNPVVGVRSFGEDPRLVGLLAAAMVEGLQAAGIAATAKHFPGHGDTSSDSHYATPVLHHSLDRLTRTEMPPFVAAIQAGVKLIMVGHVSLPQLTGHEDVPATLARPIVHDLLRHQLGFEGVVVSDSIDMAALEQGPGAVVDAIAAAAAGVDLLLMGPHTANAPAIEAGLSQATRRGLISAAEMHASAQRVLGLKQWLRLQAPPPPIAIVGSSEHAALAATVAARSITLVRDDQRLLPLRLGPGQRIAVVLPRLANLTPADTSSYVAHSLAEQVRGYHSPTIAFETSADPSRAEVDDLLAQLSPTDVVVIGTVNACAQPGQAALVNEVLRSGRSTIVAALRLPYDLAAFPSAGTYLCTYSVLAPSMTALAAVLFGAARAEGKLPVAIPGV